MILPTACFPTFDPFKVGWFTSKMEDVQLLETASNSKPTINCFKASQLAVKPVDVTIAIPKNLAASALLQKVWNQEDNQRSSTAEPSFLSQKPSVLSRPKAGNWWSLPQIVLLAMK